MRTQPVFLRLEGRRCVVVGADGPAAAKAAACLRAGAEVTLVAPALPAALATEDRVRHVARDYRSGDLAGAFLAYASTRDPGVIGQLRDEAERERDRKSTRLNSSHRTISYAVYCLKKKNRTLVVSRAGHYRT